MECTKHTGEKVFMVCKSCGKYPLVCGVCIEEGEHTEHKLQTLRNAAQSIRQDLEQVETDKRQVFEAIKSNLDSLTKIREDQQMEASHIGDEIVKRDDIIKGEVETVKKNVIQKHKTELDKNMAAIDNTEQALTRQVSQIETFQKKVTQLQKTNDYVEVIMAARDVEIPDTRHIPKPDIQSLKFLPGTVNSGELEQMFGTITGEGDDNITTVVTSDSSPEQEDDKFNISSDFVGSIKRELKIEVTPTKSFKHSQKDGIRYMFSPEPDVCFLKCKDKNSVKHADGSGQIKYSVNLGTKTGGFTVTTDNRLLFCCTNQECIKEMELPSGVFIEKIDTSPLIPNCICTGPSGDIYVTLYDEDDYDVTEDSTRVLVRYDRCGREKEKYNDGGIFVMPGEVCVNNSSTRVAVINATNDRRSELVLLDGDLCPVVIYRGPSVVTGNFMGGFKLTGVMFDSTDNILVTETCSQSVQLLSPSCEPLKTLLTIDTSPCCMTAHGNEVWVGDKYGDVKTFRYSY